MNIRRVLFAGAMIAGTAYVYSISPSGREPCERDHVIYARQTVEQARETCAGVP